MHTFAIYFCEKDQREMSVSSHSSLLPDMAPSTLEGTRWHSLGEQTKTETTCINGTLICRVCSLSPVFKDLWFNLFEMAYVACMFLNTVLCSNTVFIIILPIYMREFLDILLDYYTEISAILMPARASRSPKYSFPREWIIFIINYNPSVEQTPRKQGHKTRGTFPTL